MAKISIRFFNNTEVRAVWDDDADKWWFCAVDVIATLSGSVDARNYWYVMKNRLKRSGDELLTNCKGLKLLAPDGKRRTTDCFSTRIWLDLMLKRSLRRCVDWSKIDKGTYLDAMRRSVTDSKPLKDLVRPALTTKIADREMFMKGIDYSYYYEAEDGNA